MHEAALAQSTQPGGDSRTGLSIRGRPARRYGEGAKRWHPARAISETRSEMTQRNETLATAFEQVAGRILTVADGLSDAGWGVAPAGEARTAGQIAYHTAEVYHNVSGFIQLAVGGLPLPA